MRKFYRSMRSWVGVAVIMATMVAAVPVSFALDGGNLPDLNWGDLGAGSSLPVPFNKVISSGTVHSGDHVCVARDSITASQVQVLSGGELNFFTQYARESDPATHHRKITLGTGFRANEGSVFRAKTGVAEVGQIEHDPCTLYDPNIVSNVSLIEIAGADGFHVDDISIFVGRDKQAVIDMLLLADEPGFLFMHSGPVEGIKNWTNDVATFVRTVDADEMQEIGHALYVYARENPGEAVELGACTVADTICDAFYFFTAHDFQGNQLEFGDWATSGVVMFIPFVGGSIANKGDDIVEVGMRIQRTGEALNDALPLIKKFIPALGVKNAARKTAESANDFWKEIYGATNFKPPYKAGTEVLEFELDVSTKFVRVTNDINDPTGQWIMQAEEITGLTAAEIKNNFSLKEMPTHVVDVQIPAGTKLRAGEAALISGWGNGEGYQIDMMQRRNFGETYSNLRPL